jgi:type I restriction enzyme S subunit
LLALSAYTGVRPRPEDGGNQLPSKETITGYWVARPGDLVFNPMWALEGGVAVSEYRGALSTAYRVYDLGPAIAPRFAHYYFRSRPAIEQYRLMVRGLTTFDRSVSREDFEAMPMPFPPRDVQQSIADYLDTETARIDALISKKQRMIELTEVRVESLAGEILDPLISIYGEVPLKAVAQLRVSNVDKKTKDDESAVLLCNYTDVYYNPRIDSSLEFMSASADTKQIERLTIKKGDVLITKDSETADDIAVPALVAEDLPGVVLGYHLAMLRPFAVDSLFLYWSIRSRRARDAFALAASGVTRFGLRQDAMSRVPVPAVPLREQRIVAEKIESEVVRGREVAKRLLSQIALLRERRQALITEAVTGQLDIPEVAA